MGIRTLLVTGANNHDWARSAPYCRDLMHATGRFDVRITEDPSPLLSDGAAISRFDLFFVDYNGPEWDDRAKQNLIAAVKGGAGVCILHAADNAFDGWVEYECGTTSNGRTKGVVLLQGLGKLRVVMPVKPSRPVPRSRCISTVST